MAPQGGDPCGFQAGRASPYDGHFLGLFRPLQPVRPLPARGRVDGAGQGFALHDPAHAPVVAADARADPLRLPLLHLLDPGGVGQQPLAEGDDIRLPFGDDPFRDFRNRQFPHRDDRYAHDLFDGCGHAGHQGGLLVDGRVGPVPAVIAAGIDVEGIETRGLQHSGHLQPLFDIPAGFDERLAGQGSRIQGFDVMLQTEAVLDREVRAGFLFNLPQDFDGQPQSPFEGSSVFVRPFVPEGGGELVEEIALVPVQLHAVDPGCSQNPGGFPEGLHQLLDLVGLDLPATLPGVPVVGNRRSRHRRAAFQPVVPRPRGRTRPSTGRKSLSPGNERPRPVRPGGPGRGRTSA